MKDIVIYQEDIDNISRRWPSSIQDNCDPSEVSKIVQVLYFVGGNAGGITSGDELELTYLESSTSIYEMDIFLDPWWPFFPTYSSVQFSPSVLSDYLRPHGLQHAKPPCPSPTPGVYSNSCPLSQWCHPTISFSVVPFSSCVQPFPASGSSQMSQLFASGGQSSAHCGYI